MSLRYTVSLVLVLLLLTGCGGPRAVLGLDSQLNDAKSVSTVPIYVATNRARSDNLSLPYSAARSLTLNFAKFDISIPPNHRPGHVEKTGRSPDPARHFTARSFQPLDGRKQFIEQLNVALMRLPPGKREIFIFVHGYNNNFADSIFRNAQIVHDYNVQSVALHYAWPSAGSLPLYVYDRDSTYIGRSGLAETIEIAAQTKAERILLVGHSMGALVVMEGLRDLALTERQRYLDRLTTVVLAAPDIDVDVFQKQTDDIGKLPEPFTILVSRRDRALNVSGRIAGGHPRVGDGSDIGMLQKKNITVLDASDLDGGTHSVFASSETLMNISRNNGLIRGVVEGNTASTAETLVADGTSVLQGAANLVIYLPVRLLGAATSGIAY
ncbi:MAG: alpha/beta hydrolase [Phyllobacterium sp.]